MVEITALLVKILAIVTALMGMQTTLDARVGVLEHNAPAQSITFGSASSASIVNGCQDVNGVTSCSFATVGSVASSTCSFRLPGATSTVRYAAAKITNSGGAVGMGEWGWSRDVMSTTTSLGFGTYSATIPAVIVASTTAAASLNPATVLPPGGYLVFKVGSSTPTGMSVRCSAEVTQI